MYNVLIVDDEQAIRKGMSVIIDWKSYGYNPPTLAEDGEDALEKFDIGKYDLVITDIRMPVINGLELISKIRMQNSFIKILIISGYSDFEYAKKAIESDVKGYILKPINRNDLIQHISKIKLELDAENISAKLCKLTDDSTDKLFWNLINGCSLSTQLHEYTENIGIDRGCSCYCIAMLEIDNFKNIVKGNQESANFIKYSVRNIIEKIIVEEQWGFVYEYSENTFGILLCGYKFEEEGVKIYEIFEDIQLVIFNFIRISVNIAFGNIVTTIPQLKDSLIQANNVLQQNLMQRSEDAEIKSCSSEVVYRSIFKVRWDIKNLLSAIETSDEENIYGELDTFVNKIMQLQSMKDMIQVLFFKSIFSICELLNKYHVDAASIFSLKEMSSMVKIGTSIGQLKEWLTLKCFETSKCIRELREDKPQRVIFTVKEYIDKHYTDNISLKSIASKFYFNPSYLGRLFNNSFGMSFNDYLNKIRIAEVKEMVLHKEKSIHEAIAKVGYNNHEHFYRQFKRYEGIPFVEFREKVKIYENISRPV